MPELTVILTHYDTAQYLRQAVSSVLHQTFGDFDLYVLDDHTPDDCWLKQLEDFSCDRRLKIYRSNKNVGTYRLKNAVIRMQADSRYTAFQDADDFSMPTRFEKQLRSLKHARSALVGANYYELFAGNQLSAVKMPQSVSRPAASGKLPYLSLHPTWIWDNAILSTLVGFDDGARVAGDDEFLQRSLFVTSVANVQDYLYVKRQHERSLINAPTTGMCSRLRRDYVAVIHDTIARLRRAKANELPEQLARWPAPRDFELTRVH